MCFSDKCFYVYAYLRENNNIPYYIGKGSGERMFKKHKGISVPKDKSKIVIMENNLTEIGALALERRYISWYGRKDLHTGVLLNKTFGGDGVAGYKHTEETKKILKIVSKSIGNKGKKMSEEAKLKMSKAKIGNTPWNKGKKTNKISWNKGINYMSKGNLKRMKDLLITDPNGTQFFVKNLSQFCRQYNLNQGAMSLISQGKKQHHKKWVCTIIQENNLGNS